MNGNEGVALYLAKAQSSLQEARAVADILLAEAAGRAACLAAFPLLKRLF